MTTTLAKDSLILQYVRDSLYCQTQFLTVNIKKETYCYWNQGIPVQGCEHCNIPLHWKLQVPTSCSLTKREECRRRGVHSQRPYHWQAGQTLTFDLSCFPANHNFRQHWRWKTTDTHTRVKHSFYFFSFSPHPQALYKSPQKVQSWSIQYTALDHWPI